MQDGSGYLERKELDNFLVDLIVNQYGVCMEWRFWYYYNLWHRFVAVESTETFKDVQQ